jgi:hypothetical protein
MSLRSREWGSRPRQRRPKCIAIENELLRVLSNDDHLGDGHGDRPGCLWVPDPLVSTVARYQVAHLAYPRPLKGPLKGRQ